jgi:heme exporter protein B
MSLAAATFHLFRREWMLEQRQKYALYGMLLYVVSTVFVCKFSFRSIQEVPVWTALFWIILLFASVTGIARSFAQENRGRLLYLYSLADPRALLLAKLLYNTLLMLVLGITGLFMYAFLIGYPVQDTAMFSVSLLLGCCGLSMVFTMISAIASKAGNNFALMAILGFPVILPLLLSIIRLSKTAADGLGWSVAMPYVWMMLVLNITVGALVYLLFPYLWRD